MAGRPGVYLAAAGTGFTVIGDKAELQQPEPVTDRDWRMNDAVADRAGGAMTHLVLGPQDLGRRVVDAVVDDLLERHEIGCERAEAVAQQPAAGQETK